MAIFLTLFLVISCECKSDWDPAKIFVQVEKVYMQSQYEFIFLKEDGTMFKIGGHSGWYIHWSSTAENVKIFRDVPKDKSKFIVDKRCCSGGSTYVQYLHIHLHSFDELHGGGWNRGKFGSGQTVPLN